MGKGTGPIGLVSLEESDGQLLTQQNQLILAPQVEIGETRLLLGQWPQIQARTLVH